MVVMAHDLDARDDLFPESPPPNPARIYDYLLGGKDHYDGDRHVADELAERAPGIMSATAAGRRFMTRAVHHASVHGIRQFLDIGAGLPCSRNVHDVAQQFASTARVVYVDDDPGVVANGQARLTCARPGTALCLRGDLRRPADILTDVERLRALDASEPVALLLLNVLHVVADEDEARAIIDSLLDPWPPGSMLAVATFSHELAPARAAAVMALLDSYRLPAYARSAAEIRALFTGTDLVAPGVVPVHRWHSGPADLTLPDDHVLALGGVSGKAARTNG
jgi:O-methyltransferase involved in polyketide biosynthesis